MYESATCGDSYTDGVSVAHSNQLCNATFNFRIVSIKNSNFNDNTF